MRSVEQNKKDMMKEKKNHNSDRVRMVVVCEFYMGNFISPESRIRSTEDP